MPTRTLLLPIQGLDDHDSVAIDDVHCPNLRNVRSDRSRIVRGPGGTLLAPAPVPGTDPGFGMKTGTFTMNTSTGNQTVTHNLRVTPKALILFLAGPTGFVTPDTSAHYAVGMTDGTTSRSSAVASASGSPSQTARRYADAILTIVGTTNTTLSTASFVSWTSTTFTINWSAVDGQARKVAYAIFGHASLSATLVEWTLGAATGNQAVTGTAFTPDLVIHMGAGLTATGNSTDALFGLSAMDASGGQYAHCAQALNGDANHNAHSVQSVLHCLNMIAPNGTEMLYEAEYVSMNANGFTVNRLTAPPTGRLIASLCFDGFSNVRVGTFPGTSTTVPGVSSVTNAGFEPTGFLQIGGGNSTLTQGVAGLDSFIGTADGTNQAGSAWTDSMLSSTVGAQNRGNGFYIDTDTQNKGYANSGTDFFYKLKSFESNGFTLQVVTSINDPVAPVVRGIAWALPGTIDAVGVIRNYADLIVGGGTPTEKILMLTSKSAFTYTSTSTTEGTFDSTAESYSASAIRRFSIANGADATYGAVSVWSQGDVNLRRWDGTTFGALITAGTNHAARTVLSFNNRIISVRPYVGGVDEKTQIRWCVNGDYADWSGTGSGTLEVIETSNQPLTGGFVLAGRCFLTRAREVIELIATGSLSPVFIAEPRVSGSGCIATHSAATGDVYAFFLGPDEVYQYDGAQLKAVGGLMYNTITEYVAYANLDEIQGVVYQPNSEYWLLVPPYCFIYDYRRDIWYWDDADAFTAIGSIKVADVFTGDIDHSEFIVVGDESTQSVRMNPSVNTYLDNPIDAYFETKDFTAIDNTSSGRTTRRASDPVVSYDRLNSVYRVWFRSVPATTIEVGISTDLGETYPDIQTVTVNGEGIGIAYFERAFSVIRLRFRNGLNETFFVRGPLQYEYTVSGIMAPGY